MSLDIDTLNALKGARERALIIRDFVWITAQTYGGSPVSFGFCSEIEDVTISLLDVRTGTTLSRSFVGGGALLAIPSIPQSAGLSFQSVKIRLNRSHAQVQNLFLSNNAGNAQCDIYRGVFDADTHLIVAPPTIRLPGKIDSAKQTISKVGGQDYIETTVVSSLRELTKTNPNKKSHATQKAMRADNWRKYEGKKSPVDWGEFVEEAQPAPSNPVSEFFQGVGDFFSGIFG